MKSPVIKVCGIQTIQEAKLCIEAGVNTLGFLVGLTHMAEDKITAEAAVEIIAELPSDIDSWMVTHLLDADEIARVAVQMGVNAVQIHDDLDDAGIKKLKRLCPRLELVKAVHVTGNQAMEKAAHYGDMPEIDALLLDSRTADRLGGTGLTHDWRISRSIVGSCHKPVILAGGIKPENMVEAVSQVSPAGIDANSGVENGSGAKDMQRVQDYVTSFQTIYEQVINSANLSQLS